MFILMIGSTGIKNGFFKQTVLTVGTILTVVLAFAFKDTLADWFSYNLPFFNFLGPIKGLTTINIIMYQMLAFLIMLIIFGIETTQFLFMRGIFDIDDFMLNMFGAMAGFFVWKMKIVQWIEKAYRKDKGGTS